MARPQTIGRAKAQFWLSLSILDTNSSRHTKQCVEMFLRKGEEGAISSSRMEHAPEEEEVHEGFNGFGVAGASLAATASGAAAGMLLPGTAPFILSEEEISDVSLATFHLFGPEKDITGQPLLHLTRCGGCGCGGGGCGRAGRCRTPSGGIAPGGVRTLRPRRQMLVAAPMSRMPGMPWWMWMPVDADADGADAAAGNLGAVHGRCPTLVLTQLLDASPCRLRPTALRPGECKDGCVAPIATRDQLNMAPWGSLQWTAEAPLTGSNGPLRIWPRPASTRRCSPMSSTLK